MDIDNLDAAQEAIDDARSKLGYLQGTKGLIRREEPLQLALDAIEHVAGELRELRERAFPSPGSGIGPDGKYIAPE